MKKNIFILSILILILCVKSNAQVGISVSGKKFIGKAVNSSPGSGFEGGGQRGYFKFSSNSNSVEFIWPEGDEINIGTYKQTNLILEITSQDNDIYTFTVSNDGKTITDNKSKMVFRDEKFPW